MNNYEIVKHTFNGKALLEVFTGHRRDARARARALRNNEKTKGYVISVEYIGPAT